MSGGKSRRSGRGGRIERRSRGVSTVVGVALLVLVVVLVDNVHWTNVPRSATGPHNWTDAPPSEITTGEDAYDVTGGNVDPITSGTEPTNDIYMVFKPGCEGSELKLVREEAGYDNAIYMNDEEIVENTNNASAGQVFPAPGVECHGDAEW